MSKKSISDSFSEQSVPRLPKPLGRFNEWGHRKYITIPHDEADTIEREISRMGLSPRARQLMRGAMLTHSKGYEFVFISNAQFPTQILINNDSVQIVPCFKPFPMSGGGPADINQMAMMSRGRFIYDGWAPDESLSQSCVETLVRELDIIASSISLVGSYYAQWEPKYFARDPIQSYMVSNGELKSFYNVLGSFDSIPESDRTALQRTIGWLASAASSSSPINAFLDYFVALESLITYIERDASSSSPLSEFRIKKKTRSERKEETINCISNKLDTIEDLTQAIRESYFDCIVGIRKLIEEHLQRNVPEKDFQDILFKREPGSKSLWDIRGRIAHGELDLLSESEVLYVARSLPALEELVREYVRKIATRATRSEFFSRRRRPVLSFAASEGYGTPDTVYEGPTQMAKIYLGTSDLEGPHVRFTFQS